MTTTDKQFILSLTLFSLEAARYLFSGESTGLTPIVVAALFMAAVYLANQKP